ncbi:PmoA family protein [Luteitalea sp. TBR-22]|uniref:DUF6807 domain-containing protein n=1 Tax=Luteitalea sp. TBR-22 TaxID=2802971 RepID=UPI001EF479B5|nr:PmoA family protein [Luteitalea sp. TBR-22]
MQRDARYTTGTGQRVPGTGSTRTQRTATMALVGALALGGIAVSAQAPKVAIRSLPAEKKVEVTVDGKPFTTYMWPDTLEKPVLYPISTAAGTVITRGFPTLPGERTDHPHHVGLWFNYGDVDGFDFWNNSDAIKPDQKPKMGSVKHREVVKAESKGDHATLQVKADWVSGDGKTRLHETTTFTFRAAAGGVRMIDRVTTLAAARGTGTVKLTDNKEGTLGLRVIRALEDPDEKGNTAAGSTGKYLSSEGKVGKDVWGTRGTWTKLSGQVDGKDVTVAIIDSPGNPGYPTYWHARGYGLFAANPLGQAALSNNKDTLNFSISEGKPATFRYRILVLDANPTAEQMQKYAAGWAATSNGS